MELDFLGKKRHPFLQSEDKSSLAKKVFAEQTHLLYEQNPFAILIQFSLSIILSLALWSAVSHSLLLFWQLALLVIYSGWIGITLFYQRHFAFFNLRTWFTLTATFTFLAGCGWGLVGSLLIPPDLAGQTLVTLFLFGVTAASISFFAVNLRIFALFFLPCFLPFTFWLFAQGKFYFHLGLSCSIYVVCLLISCYFINNLLKSALVLYYKSINLDHLMEQELTYQANHDPLTKLPNRTLLYDRIDQSIAYAKRYNIQLYLLFFDIDNFKLINDNLGHNLGDNLLKNMAIRLKLEIRESDTVCRFGGDEFVILFVTNKFSSALQLAKKIVTIIAKPISLEEQQIVVTSSLGVCTYPKDGKDAASLLQHAELAMYLAKKEGGNHFKLYHQRMKRQSEKSLSMQIELRNGLANKEFFLLYQPTININTGQITGVEALVRWHHPVYGVLQPQQFIPIAEESKIIVPLGEWVFRNACLQNKAWQKKGLKAIRMEINVSGVQLLRESFYDSVIRALEDSQLDPHDVEIELTESIVLNDQCTKLQTLKHLKEIGVNLTIDDFGTGYSCLNYLREFPITKLKIDQSFIRHCIQNVNDASLVEAIIAMGHGLKLTVLAEGIETALQLHFLKQYHCDEGQGYYYGEPMNADCFAQFLRQR